MGRPAKPLAAGVFIPEANLTPLHQTNGGSVNHQRWTVKYECCGTIKDISVDAIHHRINRGARLCIRCAPRRCITKEVGHRCPQPEWPQPEVLKGRRFIPR